MSGATANDSPFYKPLLQQTAKAGFTMKEVSADKGYISMKNLQTTVDHGRSRSFLLSQIRSRIVAQMFGQKCSSITTTSAKSFWPTITNGQTSKVSFK
jgi:hypothetical protein